jgi:hypothetical protein
MALNPSGAISLAGPSAGQSIAIELGQSATATISLNDTNVRTLAQVPSGVIVMPTDFYGKSNFTPTQKAIFGYGQTPSTLSITNLVSSTGVVASDTPGVGTARAALGCAGYGADKAIFAYGSIPIIISNLVSNIGVVSTDTPIAGVQKNFAAGARYGNDKALFAFGTGGLISNLVSNTGVVASDTPIAGTPLSARSGTSYGGDKAIYAFGQFPSAPNGFPTISNLVSNTGVVASDTSFTATGRNFLTAANYGNDKAIFGFGRITAPAYTAITNLVSNTGVIASDTPGVATAKARYAASNYGGDKAIFAFGDTRANPGFFTQNSKNLVSNTGVVAADAPGVGTGRYSLAAAGYSTTA